MGSRPKLLLLGGLVVGDVQRGARHQLDELGTRRGRHHDAAPVRRRGLVALGCRSDIVVATLLLVW